MSLVALYIALSVHLPVAAQGPTVSPAWRPCPVGYYFEAYAGCLPFTDPPLTLRVK